MNKILLGALFLAACTSCNDAHAPAAHTELWDVSVTNEIGNCGHADVNVPDDVEPGTFNELMASSLVLERFSSFACVPTVNDDVVFARCSKWHSDGKLFGDLKYDGTVGENIPGTFTAMITVDFAYGDGSGGCHGIYSVVATHTYDCPVSDGPCTPFKPETK